MAESTTYLTREEWRAAHPNNGRPLGASNTITRELKTFWHRFFTSEEYREKAKQRILAGTAPHLESYLFNRIYGKPKEYIELSVGQAEDLSLLSMEELAQRADILLSQLRDARELEDAIPAQYQVQKTGVDVDTTTEATNVEVAAVDPRSSDGAQAQDQETALEDHQRPAPEPPAQHGKDGEVTSQLGGRSEGEPECSAPSSPTT